MGIVYLARNVILERPVAIKPLATAIAARGDVQRRFLREACIAAQCFHPNIVPIHGVEESGEFAWFVTAYVPAETLADRLRRARPLPRTRFAVSVVRWAGRSRALMSGASCPVTSNPRAHRRVSPPSFAAAPWTSPASNGACGRQNAPVCHANG